MKYLAELGVMAAGEVTKHFGAGSIPVTEQLISGVPQEGGPDIKGWFDSLPEGFQAVIGVAGVGIAFCLITFGACGVINYFYHKN